MSLTPINILLVDDHELIRTGIKSILSQNSQINILAEASSGEQAIQLLRELKPDIILMDVMMPGIGGLETARRLMLSNPKLRIIIVTACDEEPLPSRLLQAGAAGYLTKDCEPEEMLNAIEKVFNGKRYISQRIAEQIAIKRVNEAEGSLFDTLSERELQIMLLITSGLEVSEISEQLHLSPKTVNTYRYRLFDKLNIKNDVELTLMALRHGMLDHDLFVEESPQ